jgi:acetyl esterase/lipase
MSTAIPLWPDGAPGLDQAAPAFDPTITPYPCPGDDPAGAVVICPGGGYAGRADHEGEPIARWLNTCGLHAFVCDYRVAPYRHPFPLVDAQRAVRWVRAHAAEYRVDPARVGLLGFSAGGHLVSTVGTHFDLGDPDATDPVDRLSCRPDALILCYAVISFGPHGHTGSMHNLLGDDPPPDLVLSLSNELQVTAETPPTFLWHTADDAGVPVENSLLFAQALSAHRVPHELHVYQSGRHGLGLAEEDPHVASWSRLSGEWLKGLGF